VRVTFFCFAKRKSPKKRRPPVCDPFALRRGNLRRGDCGVRRGTRFALARAARTTTASQITKHARSDARATPQPPRRRRSQQGWDSRTSKEPDIHSGHCFARPGLAGASATRCANWAERSKGPCGCFAPFAPLDAPRSAAGGVACVPKDTHASLSSSPQLFERSAPARSEFCGAPRSRAPQVAPARSAGVADSGVAFSLVTFFWRRKRKLLARRAIPGLRPQPEHAFPTSTPRLRQAQPERMGRRTGFDGLSMNGLKD